MQKVLERFRPAFENAKANGPRVLVLFTIYNAGNIQDQEMCEALMDLMGSEM
jgi:hypothetical protein